MSYTVEDLAEVDKKLAELKTLRKTIVKDLTTRERLALRGSLLDLYNFIESNPMCDKQTILAGLPNLSPKEYNNMMNKLVRNRGITANHGSRSQPRWVVR